MPSRWLKLSGCSHSPRGAVVLVWILKPKLIGLAAMAVDRCRSRQIAGSQNHDRDNYPIRRCALGRPGSMAGMTAMLLDISSILHSRHSLERGRAWR